jgi:vacuolar-type H+-ATPase subunit F/Vma7
MPNSKPLAIIGDEDIVLGFKALGFKVYPIKEPKQLDATLDEIVTEEIAVCLVQEDIYNARLDKINSFRNLAQPIFIPFDKFAKMSLLETIVKNIRLRATGAF